MCLSLTSPHHGAIWPNTGVDAGKVRYGEVNPWGCGFMVYLPAVLELHNSIIYCCFMRSSSKIALTENTCYSTTMA